MYFVNCFSKLRGNLVRWYTLYMDNFIECIFKSSFTSQLVSFLLGTHLCPFFPFPLSNLDPGKKCKIRRRSSFQSRQLDRLIPGKIGSRKYCAGLQNKPKNHYSTYPENSAIIWKIFWLNFSANFFIYFIWIHLNQWKIATKGFSILFSIPVLSWIMILFNGSLTTMRIILGIFIIPYRKGKSSIGKNVVKN